ncbi:MULTISPECIES: hypothetical protein [Streptomyces diastaticus group]|uniref:hypothetical protein n=1 Tax=Streptomyces diastaticus group TaxID=2849069 RepID=UPI0013C9EDDC|nr:hypothetical protein [Streptomyces rutgersensis]GFH66345.1 hypothetical protein Srut_28590 [Streptomyces rutgersensis]
MDPQRRADALTGGLGGDLARPAAIDSAAFPGRPGGPGRRAGDLVADLLQRASVPHSALPDTGAGYRAAADGPACRAAREAPRDGWGEPDQEAATGGPVPPADDLAEAACGVEGLLLGAQDSRRDPHTYDERVLFGEPRGTVLALSPFVRRFADERRRAGEAR